MNEIKVPFFKASITKAEEEAVFHDRTVPDGYVYVIQAG